MRLTWFIITPFKHNLKIKMFYILPTQGIYVFCVDLRKNSDYFPI